MTGRRRQNGHSLAGTMVFLILAMLLWMAVHRQTAGHLRAEKACRLRLENSTGPRRAAATALSLLETGEPALAPGEWYRCRVLLADGAYVVTYTRTGTDPLTYSVHVRPRTSAFDDIWPVAPETFGS